MKMLTFVCIISLLSFLSALATNYADPGRCIGACNVRDPGLVRRESDGRYFRFSTGDMIKYAFADSLAGPWIELGSVMPNGSVINLPGRRDLWAPDVHKVGSLYYVYYSVSTLGSQTSAIGLAISESMELGSWTDHGSVIESNPSKEYNTIDANLFKERCRLLLIFGSYWHDIFQVNLNENGTIPISSPHNIAYEPAGNHQIEGSYLYRYGQFYYLFYSWGAAGQYNKDLPPRGQEYRIKVCRSLSPSGGFVGELLEPCMAGGGKTVLESHGEVYGPGGQGVFTDLAYGPVLYYHYTNTSIGYANRQQRFGWNPLNFSSGWPTVYAAENPERY